MTAMQDIMRISPVIPVIVIDDLSQAVPLAQALVDGGLPVLEVTLRTPAALEAIRLMQQVDGALVGAGTVLNRGDLDRALDAGARFIVSPGLTAELGGAAVSCGVPYLPGISTASDIMRGLDLGLSAFKFFPASVGGIPALRALSAAFRGVHFCPTGGVTPQSAADWLALDPVLCVGGSWLYGGGPVDTDRVRQLALQASQLAKPT